MWIVLGLLACSGEEKESGDSPPPINQDSGSTVVCEGSNPVITELEIGNGGIDTFEGENYPTILFAVTADDEDGDLDVITIFAWWDEVLDGAVDTSGAAPAEGEPRALDGAGECLTFTGGLQFSVGMDGGDPAFDTLYEFAVVIADSHGLLSEPAIESGYTPTEDGLNGGE